MISREPHYRYRALKESHFFFLVLGFDRLEDEIILLLIASVTKTSSLLRVLGGRQSRYGFPPSLLCREYAKLVLTLQDLGGISRLNIDRADTLSWLTESSLKRDRIVVKTG